MSRSSDGTEQHDHATTTLIFLDASRFVSMWFVSGTTQENGGPTPGHRPHRKINHITGPHMKINLFLRAGLLTDPYMKIPRAISSVPFRPLPPSLLTLSLSPTPLLSFPLPAGRRRRTIQRRRSAPPSLSLGYGREEGWATTAARGPSPPSPYRSGGGEAWGRRIRRRAAPPLPPLADLAEGRQGLGESGRAVRGGGRETAGGSRTEVAHTPRPREAVGRRWIWRCGGVSGGRPASGELIPLPSLSLGSPRFPSLLLPLQI